MPGINVPVPKRDVLGTEEQALANYSAKEQRGVQGAKIPTSFTPKSVDYSGLDKLGHTTPFVKPRVSQPSVTPAMPKIATVIATPTPKKTTIMPSPTPPPDRGAEPYVVNINDSAKKHGVPQDILYKVLQKESMHFNPDVISGKLNSPVGAQGIAQFMPATAKGLGLNPLDPTQAIPAAAKYLKAKFDRHGSWKLALAAYNAGSGNVEKYGGVPPFKETQNYVNSILNLE
jgi:membrane-bound lytic murein transglycosylase B